MIKEYMFHNAQYMLRWKMQVAYNCYNRHGTRHKCPCNNSSIITYEHIKRCLVYDRAWTLAALEFNLYKEEI